MPISVVDPVGPAIERVKKILFRPFDLSKWIVLGFCAFLSNLGEGGGSLNFNPSGGPGGGGGGGDSRQVLQWLKEHLALVIAIAIAVVLVSIAIGLVLTWLNSRGKFMFLDGIVHNRAAVAKPWKEYRREANSLFAFRVFFGFATVACLLSVASLGAVIAWPDIERGNFGSAAILALAIGIPTALLIILVVGVLNLFLLDLVMPIMYLRRLRVLAAWYVFWDEFLAGRVGIFVLYILFKIVIAICVGVLTLLIICATCCIAVLPYIGTVILLPVLVFDRAYPVYFIQQFGAQWQFFQLPAVIPVAEEIGGAEE